MAGRAAGWKGARWLDEPMSMMAMHLLVPVGLTVLFAGAPAATFDDHLQRFVTTSIATVAIGTCVVSACRFADGFTPRASPRLSAVFHGLATVVGFVLGVEIAARLIAAWSGGVVHDIRDSVLRVGGVVVALFAIMGVGYRRLRRRARDVELREENARREALRAQLEALQARTQPHFLFNCLNTIASLIPVDADRAERATEHLADLLRHVLASSRRARIPLAEELAAVRSYLELERHRFGDRLRVELDVDPEAESFEVPPLVLQPIVENAVQHGISARPEGGHVHIAARRAGPSLLLTVDDDGPGPGRSPHAGNASSHENLRERLRLAYRGQARFSAGPRQAGGYRVEIVLP